MTCHGCGSAHIGPATTSFATLIVGTTTLNLIEYLLLCLLPLDVVTVLNVLEQLLLHVLLLMVPWHAAVSLLRLLDHRLLLPLLLVRLTMLHLLK